jgi:xylulose-5-phosphate/fructose-6-phosphate phosphoketolase
VRVVNVVDLMKLQPHTEHPHGLTDPGFDAMFPPGVPVEFNFHGYPWLIHRLTYRRAAHPTLHVRGYKEEGTTTTPFDTCVLNQVDRFNLFLDIIRRVPGRVARAASVAEGVRSKLAEHRRYITEHGVDMPEVSGWTWKRGTTPTVAAVGDTGADNT